MGTYALEEFRINTLGLIPTTLETKNDYLFVGNTETEFFDIEYDARAYGYLSGQITRVYEQDGSYYHITDNICILSMGPVWKDKRSNTI